MKRRHFLSSLALGSAAVGASSQLAVASGKKAKHLRVIHITDMHIKHGEVQKKGIENLLKAIDQLDESPDFILNTGDNVSDSLKHSKESTLQQWEAWNEYFRSKLKYPLYNCLGNHDIWGWYLKEPEVVNDPEYGKIMGMKHLGMESSYYHFEKKGWHFLMLDSLTFKDHKYYGKLGDEQLAWLKNQLEGIPSDEPVCVASHIPILSPAAFFGAKRSETSWDVSVAIMHDDAKEIKDLFYQHPNVKTALSGHLHLLDKAEYLKVGYCCNGAVSGGWWKGKNQEFGPAFAVLDFYDDGTFHCEQVMI